MKFPLENNNGGIIKKLAKRSLAADRRRNLFIILTITLSVCLMGVTAFYYSSSQRQTLMKIRGQYQAGCNGISKERALELCDTGFFESWGMEYQLGTPKYKDSVLICYYLDEGMLKLDNWAPITGAYPQKADEIVLERAFLNNYSLPSEIGSIISLDLDGSEKSYILSGILEQENTSRMFNVFISDALVRQHNKGNDSFYTLKFRMKYSERLEPEALKADIAAFFDRMDIHKDNTFYSSNYFDMANLYLGTDYSVYAAALFIAVACAIVIYNIFYISVIGKMREYGRMKVIGATTKQLSLVVRRERRILAAVSIPLGLLIAGILIALLLPGCWDWSANIRYTIAIVLITEAVLVVSTRRPIQLAGRVSAIEAVRTTAYASSPERKRRQSHSGKHSDMQQRWTQRHISLLRLAVMNFSRNKKKAGLTLASLGFTGILLMCAAAYGSSIDFREMARKQLGDGGDYLISWSFSGVYNDLSEIQKENPLSREVINRLGQLPGVVDIRAYGICSVKIPALHETDSFYITGLTKEQFDRLVLPENLLEGEINYDLLCSGSYLLVEDTSDHLMKKLYGTQLHAGDKVTTYASNGSMREMTVLGVIKTIETGSGGNFFILPEETFPLFYPEIHNFTGSLNLDITEDTRTLREAIFEAVPDSRVIITSVTDLAESMRPQLRSVLNGVYGLVVFLFMFALLNLVNTLITNILSRQQEFGILQSVGMSTRQLTKMLSLECLIYIGGTLLITCVAGTAASVLVCSLFSRAGIFGTLTWHFPLPPLLLFTAGLLLVQGIFSLASVRYCQKQSLVERIKTIE